MKKLIQDRDKCIGCMACVGMAPEYFASDPATGKAQLLEAQAEGSVYSREVPDDAANIDVLAGVCCGGAISVA